MARLDGVQGGDSIPQNKPVNLPKINFNPKGIEKELKIFPDGKLPNQVHGEMAKRDSRSFEIFGDTVVFNGQKYSIKDLEKQAPKKTE